MIMKVIVDNWGLILILILAIVGVVELVIAKDKQKAKEWLLLAVLEAEKLYGSKTGAVKLRYVYDMFLATFPILSRVVSFEEFSKLVDDALEEMKHLINTNVKVFEYVGGMSEEK